MRWYEKIFWYYMAACGVAANCVFWYYFVEAWVNYPN